MIPVGTAPAVGEDRMSRDSNIKVAQAYFEAFNAHDFSKWNELYADDFKGEAPGAPPLDRDQSRMYSQGFSDAFPDGRFTISHTVVEGDFVVTHWVASGTHTAPLRTFSGQTIPATGKKATVAGCTVTEVRNGKIARDWNFWDQVALLTQLGLMPPS